MGVVWVIIGVYIGCLFNDKFIVEEESMINKIDWGMVNQLILEEVFEWLYMKVVSYLKQWDELFVFEGFVGVDEKYRLLIIVVNEFVWYNLFVRQLFICLEGNDKKIVE